ncbi:LysR substrate-binding domain-containing protein [Mesorhizobium caraganae]
MPFRNPFCADYLERRGWPRSIDKLRTHDLLLIPRGDGLPWRLSLRDKDGVEHQVRLTANDPKAIDRMVLKGAGIAATARYVAAPEIEAGNLVRVLPDWSVPAVDVSLVMPAGKERSPAARAFIDFMRQQVVGNRRWFDDGA